jgi:hypothetical protein
MKTTIDIADGLFEDARKLAARNRVSFKAVVEAALRRFLTQEKKAGSNFKLKDGSFRGKGVRAPLQEGDWRSIQSMIYEGRGA